MLRTVVQRLRCATTTTTTTFLYRFDYDSPKFNLHRKKYCGDNVRGVAHGDELSYLFYSQDSWELSKESHEYRNICRMIRMWTSFARNSDPNCDAIEPIKWLPINPDHPFRMLNINIDLEMLPVLPNGKKWSFWLKLYKEYPNNMKSVSTSISSLIQPPSEVIDEKKCSDECF